MSDLYLQALMRGDITKHQISPMEQLDSFDQAIEKDIEEYLNTQTFEVDPTENKLLTPEMKRKRLKAELKEAFKMKALSEQIDLAIKIIISEGGNQQLIDELGEGKDLLNQMDPEEKTTQDLQDYLGLSSSSMEVMLHLAIKKFEETQYLDSLALFTFLGVLKSDIFDYWFRAGIAAQFAKEWSNAIKNYEIALTLNPELIQAYLFSAECYIAKGLQQEAESVYQKAKRLIEELPEKDPVWAELLTSVETLIHGVPIK